MRTRLASGRPNDGLRNAGARHNPQQEHATRDPRTEPGTPAADRHQVADSLYGLHHCSSRHSLNGHDDDISNPLAKYWPELSAHSMRRFPWSPAPAGGMGAAGR
jgi:hypothetical protein